MVAGALFVSPGPEAPISIGHHFHCNTVNTHALTHTQSTDSTHSTVSTHRRPNTKEYTLSVRQTILRRDTHAGLTGACNKYIKPVLPHGTAVFPPSRNNNP